MTSKHGSPGSNECFTQQPSAHPSRKVYVCVLHEFFESLCVQCIRPYFLVISIYAWLSLPLFVNRLQLFRSSCFYLANPCGVITKPVKVLGDFVQTIERGLSSKCVKYFMVKNRIKWDSGSDSPLLAIYFPREIVKKRLLQKAKQDLWLLFTSLPPCLCVQSSSISM